MEPEKEKDAAEKAVNELKRQLQPKKALTHDDAGDTHEMLAEVDNWDLSREATRVQNRRKVEVGPLENQGAHIDRTDHVANRSGSALPSHLWQQEVDRGTRRYED